jgi:hypothetical protein
MQGLEQLGQKHMEEKTELLSRSVKLTIQSEG